MRRIDPKARFTPFENPFRGSGTFVVATLAAACVLAIAGTARAAADPRPNVLFMISDDQSFAHTSFAGDPVVKTPVFDRVANQGVYFSQAHVVASSCTPSRASILTGRPIWELEQGANLWGTLPSKFAVFPDLLENAGYVVGSAGKGWSPGDFRPGGRTRNPAGPQFKDFDAFLKTVPADKPFYFWFGSHHPHRMYKEGSGVASGMNPANVKVPPFLPDSPAVRSDLCDYLYAIQLWDAEAGAILSALEKSGRLDNTLVVMTSDNGMPFPRAKANLYGCSTHEPLAIRWPAKVKPGRVVDDLISFTDFAPTFLEAAGVKVPAEMYGKTFLPTLTSDKSGLVDPTRDRLLLGNERHADVRTGDVAYPRRAIRTRDYLYVWNMQPDRWPAGDPPIFGDTDQAGSAEKGSPTKAFVLSHRNDPKYKIYYDLAFAKRPAEELYDLKADPEEFKNVAADEKYASVKQAFRQDLERLLKQSGDPRVQGNGAIFESYPRYQDPSNKAEAKKKK